MGRKSKVDGSYYSCEVCNESISTTDLQGAWSEYVKQFVDAHRSHGNFVGNKIEKLQGELK